MRVRGLKLKKSFPLLEKPRSHPMRVRGLKPYSSRPEGRELRVAPHAGAWIETCIAVYIIVKIVSHPMRVRGLKLTQVQQTIMLLPGRTPCGCVD